MFSLLFMFDAVKLHKSHGKIFSMPHNSINITFVYSFTTYSLITKTFSYSFTTYIYRIMVRLLCFSDVQGRFLERYSGIYSINADCNLHY